MAADEDLERAVTSPNLYKSQTTDICKIYPICSLGINLQTQRIFFLTAT